MPRVQTILITGATAGIGLATARHLAAAGHRLLVHGRSAAKVESLVAELAVSPEPAEGVVADLADLHAVVSMAEHIIENNEHIDVVINNAGVLKLRRPRLESGHDLRFVVNTLAPALLTRRLLPLLGPTSRVINLSSAAQDTVDLAALAGRRRLADFPAYAQSKLALTMWSMALAEELGPEGPVVIAVNPGSLLNTRMVQEGFGRSRAGVEVGVDILSRAALSDDFASATGRYFDNDSGRFAPPHPDALDAGRRAAVVAAVEAQIQELL